MRPPTYLDHASLTPPVPEALDAIRQAAEEAWGQPKSLHTVGRRAVYALDTARRQVADYLGASWQQIIFTSSGREALALALRQALTSLPKGASVVASRQDHPALQSLVEAASKDGYDVHWLAMPEGVPSEEDRRAIARASLLALSVCNHELGTSILDHLGAAAPDAIRVLDAVQAAPWIALDALNDDRTFYAISGAKLGAPLGIGVARVPERLFYSARASGQPLESESPPWLTAIGLGAACEARAPHRDEHLAAARSRAQELLESLRSFAPDLLVNGAPDARLGPILNISLSGHYGKSLVAALSLEGICISHTAACQASRAEVSPVVRAAYPHDPERAAAATRWSFSERVTADDIHIAADAMKRTLSLSAPSARPSR